MNLAFGTVWRETFALVARDRLVYFTIAAAFVLLPAVVVAVLGPAEPRSLADLQGTTLGLQAVVALIGTVGQLAIARLASCGGEVADSLRHGVKMVPRLVIAAFCTAFALLPALLLLQMSRTSPGALLPGLVVLIPGLYIVARLALALPILAEHGGGPIEALRRSWQATAGNAWRILGLLAALIGLMIGVILLAGGVAAAIGSVLTLLGGKSLAAFIVALISAAVASLYSVYNSVLLACLSGRLLR